jgi:hypothetical protein
MKREIIEFTESVRSLALTTSKDGAEIDMPATEQPAALLRVKQALEAVDTAGGPLAHLEEAKAALDAVIAWIASKGLDPGEALKVANSAANAKRKNRRKLAPTPSFAPDGWKKRKFYKPRLKLLPDATEKKLKSMEEVASLAFDVHAAAMLLGRTLPTPDSDRKPTKSFK